MSHSYFSQTDPSFVPEMDGMNDINLYDTNNIGKFLNILNTNIFCFARLSIKKIFVYLSELVVFLVWKRKFIFQLYVYV